MRHHDHVDDELAYLESAFNARLREQKHKIKDLRAEHDALLRAVLPILPPCVVVKSKWLIADDAGDWFVADNNIYSATETMKAMARRAWSRIFSVSVLGFDRYFAYDHEFRSQIDNLRFCDAETAITKAPTAVLSVALRLGYAYEFEYLEFYEHPFGRPDKLTPCVATEDRYKAFQVVKP